MASSSQAKPGGQRPAFLITIDTEGDNLWARPDTITTENSRYLPRFQELCERYGLKPTYLTNYEMAECPVFCEFAQDVLRRGTGEVGMHLHAWNSPPLKPLTDNDLTHHPYLIEYPEPVLRDKVRFVTDLLESRFERKMVSHRAGRWGFDRTYAQVLVEQGYLVDCSVTPHISWADKPGNPDGAGGPDYRRFPDQPYFVDLERIDRAGDSPLLEVPLSVIRPKPTRAAAPLLARAPRVARRAFHKLVAPPIAWLVPDGRPRNLKGMLALLRHARRRRWPCVEFALHSSEFMPGGSPSFPTEAAIERLYEHLEILFATAGESFRGATLAEFREAWATASETAPPHGGPGRTRRSRQAFARTC